MPRKARIDAPGAPHHVIVRWIDGRKIFRSDYDRQNLIDRIGKLILETQTDCFAWGKKVLEKAAGILNCDLDYIRHSRRISKLLKNDRDLLVYLVWKICILSNE